jgi:hypothetical protein
VVRGPAFPFSLRTLTNGDFTFDGRREAKGVFVETALSDDGILASDHRLVVADVGIS